MERRPANDAGVAVKPWAWSTIGDCCELTSGGTPSKHNPRFWKGDLPFVSARDLKTDRIETASLHIAREAVDQSSTKIAPIGSLLMLVRGMGLANGIQIGEVTSPVAFNQDIRAIHPPKTIVSRFLLLALRRSFLNGEGEKVLSSAAHGTLKIDTDALRQIAIPVPSLPEQQRIVGILDEAFAGIATAKANAEKNLRNARALFESPLDALYAKQSKDWEDLPFGELAISNEVGLVRNSKEQNGGRKYPYVKMNNITRDNRFDLSDCTTIDATEAEVARYRLRDGDFLFNTRNSVELVGKACVYEGGDDAVLYNNNIMRVRFRKGVDSRFVLFAFSSKSVRENVETLKSGTTNVAAIYYKDLRTLRIPLAPPESQQQVVEILTRLRVETQRLESVYRQKLAALDALKKSLLHQAFSGQL